MTVRIGEDVVRKGTVGKEQSLGERIGDGTEGRG